jgi:hypothetical protein
MEQFIATPMQLLQNLTTYVQQLHQQNQNRNLDAPQARSLARSWTSLITTTDRRSESSLLLRTKSRCFLEGVNRQKNNPENLGILLYWKTGSQWNEDHFE